MIRLALAVLGALVITGLLLVAAAELSRERPVVQDLTDPIPVAIVTVAPPEPPPDSMPVNSANRSNGPCARPP